MINLGDVTFSLGADTQRLQASVQKLQQFGNMVDKAQKLVKKSTQANQENSGALRRQEKALVDALNRVGDLNAKFRSFGGIGKLVKANNQAFEDFNKELTKGALNVLEIQRATEKFNTALANNQRVYGRVAAARKQAAQQDRELEKAARESVRLAAQQEQVAKRNKAAMDSQSLAILKAQNRASALNDELNKYKGTEAHVARVNAAFQALQNTLGRGQQSVSVQRRAMEDFRNTTSRVQRELRGMVNTQEVVEKKTHTLTNQIKNLGSAFVFVQGPLGGVSARLTALSALFGRTGSAIAGLGAGFVITSTAIVAAGRHILDAGKQVNAFESQLTAISGSTQIAAGRFDMLTKIARHTGVAIQDIAPAYTKFAVAADAAGVSVASTFDMFEKISAAVAKLQLNSEQAQGVFKALEQMLSKGTVQAEELRGQLGDRLAGAVQIAARALGVGTRKLQEMMKAGEVISTDFLPKFVKELTKALNIDGRPIDNYTAAINNVGTAWFQLRVEIDKQLKVTETVIAIAKRLAAAIDYTRENLLRLRDQAVLAGAAIAGLYAPAVIGGFMSLGKAILFAAFKMGTLNKLINANPFGRLLNIAIRLAFVLGTVAVAADKFGSRIKVVNGDVANLSNYIDILWQDLNKFVNIGNIWNDLIKATQRVNTLFGTTLPSQWSQWRTIAIDEITNVATFFKRAMMEIEIRSSAMWGNIQTIIYDIAKAIQDVDAYFSPWTKSVEEQRQSARRQSWLDKNFPNGRPKFTTSGSINRQVGAMWAQGPDSSMKKAAADFVKAIEDYAKSVQERANTSAKQEQYALYGSQAWKHAQTVNAPVSPMRQPGGGVDDSPVMTEKQRKALDKQRTAIENINTKLRETYDEIEALGSSERILEALTDKFKRDHEVRKYAEALRKAGVNTAFIKDKTVELTRALERRDALIKQREGVIELRDSFVQSFDAIGQAIVDGAAEGKNAWKSASSVIKSVLMDLLKTYAQLALLNPLKNALFGTSEPVLGKAFGGISPLAAVKASLPGIFPPNRGAIETISTIDDPWQNMRMPPIGYGKRGSRLAGSAGANLLPGGGAAMARMAFPSAGQTAQGIPLANIGTYAGKAVNVNAAYADRFHGLLEDLKAAGYPIRSVGEGGYSFRKVAGSNNLSKHAYGNAIDINPRQNPWAVGAKGDFAKYGIDPNQMAQQNGLFWGGNWRKGDAMHFQVDENVKSFKRMQEQVDTMTTNTIKAADTSVVKFGTAAETAATSALKSAKGMGDLGTGFTQLGQKVGQAGTQGGGGGGLGGIFQSIFGGLFGGGASIFGAGSFLTPGSMGGYGASLRFMKAGGIIKRFQQGTIINKPTMFPMGKHSAVIGEKPGQAEAVLPLVQKGGKMGVDASGAGGRGGDVYVNVNNKTDGKATVKRSKDSNGNTMIDVIIDKIRETVASDIARGDSAINKSIDGRYNLKTAAGLR
jgi:tape measure domain-containing protein